jgi:cobalt-zinc-cadmium efflux system membrane fusion protein
MVWRSKTKIFVAIGAIALVAIAGGILLSKRMPRGEPPSEAVAAASPVLSLVHGSDNRLKLSPGLIQSLGVRLAQAQVGAEHHRLKLSGSLFADSNRMVRVHSRFAGEVISIGSVQPPDLGERPAALNRPLRLGDRVTKGQLLATVWSKDVGEKKSDLVNTQSKLYLDLAQLKNLRSLPADAVAGRQVREAEREREADIIEVDRIERTLRSWRLTEEEIKTVRAEAEKIHRGDTKADLEVDKTWAEVSVRSPIDGIVLEKNVVAGDIVDTTIDLFRIADLSVMCVMANVYEEDLPVLESNGRNSHPSGDRVLLRKEL